MKKLILCVVLAVISTQAHAQLAPGPNLRHGVPFMYVPRPHIPAWQLYNLAPPPGTVVVAPPISPLNPGRRPDYPPTQLPPQFSPSYLQDGCEGDGNQSPECVPLGVVFTRYTVCPEPRTCPVVWVSVAADGLNVRGPQGEPLMSLVNGTPLLVLERRGQWTLVAPACPLVPTGAWSVTANVPLNRCLVE